MNNYRRTALASLINLALAGVTDVYAADTEALERRIRELESRLEKLGQAEALSAKSAVSVTSAIFFNTHRQVSLITTMIIFLRYHL